MLLADWLTHTKTTKAAFAARIGVTRSAMTDLCRGTKWVSARVARAIERETGGAVTVRDLLDAMPRDEEPEPCIGPSPARTRDRDRAA